MLRRPKNPNRVVINRIFVHYNSRQLKIKAPSVNHYGQPFATMKSLGTIIRTKKEALPDSDDENPWVPHEDLIVPGTEILQIAQLTSPTLQFSSPYQIAKAIAKRAKRGVELVVRNPQTGALNVKLFHSGMPPGPAPYIVAKILIHAPE